MAEDCCATNGNTMILACAGGSNVGQLSNAPVEHFFEKKGYFMTGKLIKWGLAPLLAAVFFQLQPLLPNALAESGPTVESVYPGLATGVLQSARLMDMEKGTLLQGDGIEIQASFAEKIFGKLTPEVRSKRALNRSCSSKKSRKSSMPALRISGKRPMCGSTGIG